MKVTGVPYEEIAAAAAGSRASARALAEASDDEVLAQARERARGDARARHDHVRGQDRLRALARGRAARGAAGAGARRRPRHRPVRPRGARPATRRRRGWTRSTRWPPRRTSTRSTSTSSRSPSATRTSSGWARSPRREGVPLRAHVEQFNANRSVPVALAAGARSVDHLACLHPDDLAPLAAAECAAVLLPGAEFLGAEETRRAARWPTRARSACSPPTATRAPRRSPRCRS